MHVEHLVRVFFFFFFKHQIFEKNRTLLFIYKYCLFQLYILGHYSGNFTKTDEIIRKKFSQLIVNFVNNGDPSPRSDHIFQPYNKQRGNYIAVDMHENNDVTVVKYNYHKDADDLWNQLLPR